MVIWGMIYCCFTHITYKGSALFPQCQSSEMQGVTAIQSAVVTVQFPRYSVGATRFSFLIFHL